MKISKFDSVAGAFREVDIEDYKKELLVLGLSEEQVSQMVEDKAQSVYDKAAEMIGVQDLSVDVNKETGEVSMTATIPTEEKEELEE